jgi:hypothetical protein
MGTHWCLSHRMECEHVPYNDRHRVAQELITEQINRREVEKMRLNREIQELEKARRVLRGSCRR